eukprot:g5430.t1
MSNWVETSHDNPMRSRSNTRNDSTVDSIPSRKSVVIASQVKGKDSILKKGNSKLLRLQKLKSKSQAVPAAVKRKDVPSKSELEMKTIAVPQTIQGNSKKSSVWVCSDCGYDENDESTTTCDMCDTERAEEQRVPTRSNTSSARAAKKGMDIKNKNSRGAAGTQNQIWTRCTGHGSLDKVWHTIFETEPGTIVSTREQRQQLRGFIRGATPQNLSATNLQFIDRATGEECGLDHTRAFLGRGAFGSLYRMRHMTEEEDYAVKFIDIAKVRYTHGTKAAAEVLEECQAMRQFEHKHIIRYYDTGYLVPNEVLYVRMELCRGDLVSTIPSEGPPLDATVVRERAAEIAQALMYLHDDLGWVHRDLKLDNIMLSARDGQVRVGDLGLAREAKHVEAEGNSGGHLSYRSRELLMTTPDSSNAAEFYKRADCFAFGLLISELATSILVTDRGIAGSQLGDQGKNFPFIPCLSEEVMEEIVEDTAECSQILGDVVRGLLRKEPRLRTTAAEALEMLRSGGNMKPSLLCMRNWSLLLLTCAVPGALTPFFAYRGSWRAASSMYAIAVFMFTLLFNSLIATISVRKGLLQSVTMVAILIITFSVMDSFSTTKPEQVRRVPDSGSCIAIKPANDFPFCSAGGAWLEGTKDKHLLVTGRMYGIAPSARSNFSNDIGVFCITDGAPSIVGAAPLCVASEFGALLEVEISRLEGNSPGMAGAVSFKGCFEKFVMPMLCEASVLQCDEHCGVRRPCKNVCDENLENVKRQCPGFVDHYLEKDKARRLLERLRSNSAVPQSLLSFIETGLMSSMMSCDSTIYAEDSERCGGLHTALALNSSENLFDSCSVPGGETTEVIKERQVMRFGGVDIEEDGSKDQTIRYNFHMALSMAFVFLSFPVVMSLVDGPGTLCRVLLRCCRLQRSDRQDFSSSERWTGEQTLSKFLKSTGWIGYAVITFTYTSIIIVVFVARFLEAREVHISVLASTPPLITSVFLLLITFRPITHGPWEPTSVSNVILHSVSSSAASKRPARSSFKRSSKKAMGPGLGEFPSLPELVMQSTFKRQESVRAEMQPQFDDHSCWSAIVKNSRFCIQDLSVQTSIESVIVFGFVNALLQFWSCAVVISTKDFSNSNIMSGTWISLGYSILTPSLLLALLYGRGKATKALIPLLNFCTEAFHCAIFAINIKNLADGFNFEDPSINMFNVMVASVGLSASAINVVRLPFKYIFGNYVNESHIRDFQILPWSRRALLSILMVTSAIVAAVLLVSKTLEFVAVESKCSVEVGYRVWKKLPGRQNFWHNGYFNQGVCINSFEEVTTLDLSLPSLKSELATVPKGIFLLPNVLKLSFSGQKLSSVPIKFMRFWLDRRTCDDEIEECKLDFYGNPVQQELNLDYQYIGDDQRVWQFIEKYLPNLKRLSLRGTGLRNFSGRSYLGGLTYLGLDDNANLTFIDPLLGISLPNLVSLNLSDTPMLGNMPIGGYFTANECDSYVSRRLLSSLRNLDISRSGIGFATPNMQRYMLTSYRSATAGTGTCEMLDLKERALNVELLRMLGSTSGSTVKADDLRGATVDLRVLPTCEFEGIGTVSPSYEKLRLPTSLSTLVRVHNLSIDLSTPPSAWLGNLRSLESVALHNVFMTAHGDALQDLSFLSKLTNLKSLSLRNNGIFQGFGNVIELISNARVTSLEISDNALAGNIPLALTRLGELVHLNLEHNEFSGGLKGLSGLQNLRSLNCQGNQLNETADFFMNLSTNLRNVNLANNLIRGELPKRIFARLGNIKTFNLANNRIRGRLPVLESALNISQLNLKKNKISGTIPSSIGNMSSLQ